MYEQIENAYKFVLNHINLSAEIEGIVRKDRYELPIGAIREMIINATCHRNFLDNSCIQVAVYDNRLEVTSPGMLYSGLTLEEAKSGRSKIRNRAIAEVFSRMEIIESWGTGLRRIMNRAHEYGLPEPEFLEIGDTFRVNLFRSNMSPKTDPKMNPKMNSIPQLVETTALLNELQKSILQIMAENPTFTRQEIADDVGKSFTTVKRAISSLQKEGLVKYVGSSKKGSWIVKADDKSNL